MRKAYLTSITSMSKVRSSPANGWLRQAPRPCRSLRRSALPCRRHRCDLKHHAHFGLDVFGDFATGTSMRSSSRCSPYASSAGMVTVKRSPALCPSSASSKPGIRLPSPMVNPGAHALWKNRIPLRRKKSLYSARERYCRLDCHERLLNVV